MLLAGCLRSALLVGLLTVCTLSAANDQQQPEQLAKVQQQPLRSFSDHHQDKYNGNHDPMDVHAQQQTKRARVTVPVHQPESMASITPDYYQQQRTSIYRPRPAHSRYGAFDEYDSIQRYGDAADYGEPSYPSSYSASRKTFSGQRNNNLAMVVSPLAGIAFIAAAAAVAVSPAYLTISSSLLGRKKRDLLTMIDPAVVDKITPQMVEKIQELQTLEKFLATVPKNNDYQQQIMSMYLSCSGYTQDGNACLDRIFCEYGNPKSRISEEERDVLAIVLYNIMSNDYVSEAYKQRLRSAARFGRDMGHCARFDCPALSLPVSVSKSRT